MKSTLKIKVTHAAGLHARPASLFVQTANKFSSEINVQNLTDKSDVANAKSILNVLTLGVMKDHEIEISAVGDDAEEATQALKALVDDNFGED
ncbi:HPr family phosphocarrier protein [bacterium]|nr:HPr family phosphocarrier protein [bacterium]